MNTTLHVLKKGCIIIILGVLLLLNSCVDGFYNLKERRYFSEMSNYVNVSGIVDRLYYHEDKKILTVSCTDLSHRFSERYFRICGENYEIVMRNGIQSKLKEGERIEFVSADWYFYDDYRMPIVQLTVNGEELLGFEEGQTNWMKWLDSGGI